MGSCSNPFLHSPYRSCPCCAKESESTSTTGSGAYGCRNKCACCCDIKTNPSIRVRMVELQSVLRLLQTVLQRMLEMRGESEGLGILRQMLSLLASSGSKRRGDVNTLSCLPIINEICNAPMPDPDC